jgi:hypothetical protein
MRGGGCSHLRTGLYFPPVNVQKQGILEELGFGTGDSALISIRVNRTPKRINLLHGATYLAEQDLYHREQGGNAREEAAS